MAQATRSRGGSSKTQVQAESIPAEESQNGNPEVSSREKRRHRASLARHSRLPREDHSVVLEGRRHRASLARHARKCSVCHHKDREFIDDDYLRWISPETIARQYKISHHSVVYRHADATGLRTQRRAALRATLEHFIEQAEDVRVTAHSVVAAVRLYAQINDQGQYTPSPRRHIIEHHYFGLPAVDGLPADAGTEPAAAKASASAANARASASAAPASAAKAASDRTPAFKVSNAADAAPAATSAAPSAAPSGASRDKFPVAEAAGSAQSAESAAKVQNIDGSPSSTTAANSAAPLVNGLDLIPNAAGVVPAATFAATSAAPLSESKNKLGAVSPAPSATGRSSPVATTIAGSSMPLSESPEKFPAVSVAAAPAPTKRKTTATPIATIYLQTNAISNRELLGLDHAATY
jgi:hypothetical protein